MRNIHSASYPYCGWHYSKETSQGEILSTDTECTFQKRQPQQQQDIAIHKKGHILFSASMLQNCSLSI